MAGNSVRAKRGNNGTAGQRAVTLRPGEWIVTRKPTRISTILGSCVAVCLHSEKHAIGAMCHCLLPRRREASAIKDFRQFVDSALAHLLGIMVNRYRVPLKEIRVKLFGGANVLPERSDPETFGPSVGSRNILAARNTLAQYGIRVAAEQTGGNRSYKIIFDSASGKVRLRRGRDAEFRFKAARAA